MAALKPEVALTESLIEIFGAVPNAKHVSEVSQPYGSPTDSAT